MCQDKVPQISESRLTSSKTNDIDKDARNVRRICSIGYLSVPVSHYAVLSHIPEIDAVGIVVPPISTGRVQIGYTIMPSANKEVLCDHDTRNAAQEDRVCG